MASALNLNSTTGAYLIGVFFEIWLFGFTSLQAWYYVQHYPSDPFRLKGLVALIWCLECLHAAFSCHAAYYWLVLNYLNPEALNVSVWSADSALIIAGVLVFVTHCFFCYRVWAVSGRTYIMPGIIFFLALASFGLDWAVFVLSVREKTFSGFGHAIQVTSSAGLAFKVATDTTIAGSLGFFLHRSKSGIQSTDHLVNKLTFYAINIGCLTSIIDILVLAWSEATSNLIFLALYTVVGNLYSNSLLATLNIRQYARSQVLAEDGTSLQLASMKFSDGVRTTMPGSVTVFQSESRGTIPDLPGGPVFRKGSFTKTKEISTDTETVTA
ncbi:hypothetical protein L226DRAFT_614432 [Lentinus tigrinus ALCF2SS1-7]|uniref:DUF6534 domain-containing protein n=1 Tax=Lentinus tigrinus ALCF2SS1-6 TaxID=1328759 RepID=A0A5C2RPA7_9APHY|nr:hypothetical protein L227DRAFT_424790 [Lentinus tigrinus ALCF2SS1-6]RPD73212.1 hypothetical protein L226DRAFT_614432 [Lentinus tigrinus ALCF2SS1-7]